MTCRYSQVGQHTLNFCLSLNTISTCCFVLLLKLAFCWSVNKHRAIYYYAGMAVTLRNGICMPLIGCKKISLLRHNCCPSSKNLLHFLQAFFYQITIIFLCYLVGTFRIKGRETILNCLEVALKAGYRLIGAVFRHIL